MCIFRRIVVRVAEDTRELKRALQAGTVPQDATIPACRCLQAFVLRILEM